MQILQTGGYFFLRGFEDFFGFGATCGSGGVPSIRRSTSSGEGAVRLFTIRVSHG